jgi:acetoin utilization protein AcuB
MFIDKTMTKKVMTVSKETSVLEASELMKKHSIRHLPIVDKDNILLGIVTDRDIRSAMPSILTDFDSQKERERVGKIRLEEIMTKNPITISPMNTLEDALILMQQTKVGAFPVVDEHRKLQGIISIRDLMRSFINVLGIGEPGTLLCILVENKLGQMKRIVDAISEEKVSFGSILVARYWDENKRAVFPYLLTNNVAPIKRKLKSLGFELLDPMNWYLDQLPKA